jgi:hypothetical protein
MDSQEKTRAKTQGISLFPIHQEIVDIAARQLGLQGNIFSATIQHILVDWARSRGISLRDSRDNLQNYAASHAPISIGYLRLSDLATNLDPTRPVYIAPFVESINGTVPGQRTDHHYIMVTQPNALNHVHYCRILVVRLVYHNGIAFAPDYGEQLAKVKQVRGAVETWLVGEGFKVWAGMVALPEGLVLVEGMFRK